MPEQWSKWRAEARLKHARHSASEARSMIRHIKDLNPPSRVDNDCQELLDQLGQVLASINDLEQNLPQEDE